MDKMYNSKLTLWIIINIFYVFIGSYLFSSFSISQLNYTYGFIPLLIFNIIIGIIYYMKSNKKDNIYLILLLIVITLFISTIFAINKKVALFGFINRHEGLISVVYYLSLTFISTFVSIENKKKIIHIILITGIIQVIYAIMQTHKIPFTHTIYNDFITYDTNNKLVTYKIAWATGFTLNPNFYGTYILICLLYALSLFVESKNKNRYIYFISIGILFYGLLISNATSSLVGLIIAMICLLIYIIKNKYYKKFILIILLLISITFISVKLDKTTLLKDLFITSNETKEILKGNIKDSYGTKRIYIWRKTLEIVPKYLLHGAGIDNFYYAFGDMPLSYPSARKSYDKAHNEYLQILITDGVFTLLLYLIMYFKALRNGIKNNDIVVLLPVIGYLVQAFFNISIISVTPIFYITLGLCLEKE